MRLRLLLAVLLGCCSGFAQETAEYEKEPTPPAVLEELDVYTRFETTGTAEEITRVRIHIRTE
ncbi:MAG: hypothetical protein HY653_05185, partial [Acidobacteria bacterium]|nr:hypothetical protein [Acidobacteriota bacterium]